jgi:glucose-6-phosphate isomerase
MLNSKIRFKSFKVGLKNKKIKDKIKKNLTDLKKKNQIIKSLTSDYKDSYNKKITSKLDRFKKILIIGMGGSILGTKAIYNFLKEKIRKEFVFIDNLKNQKKIIRKDRHLNLIISKSGNTIETIVNSNIYLKKNDKSIFITENKKSYLQVLASKLKAEIIHHNNYIGGRYSVLSEVGMLPAELMGLNVDHFRQFNSLIKNKSFFNSLVDNVASTFYLFKKKKFNSIIINYDESSSNFFYWYQQLIAESLGKKKKGFLPIISIMPKDNHSVMQFYLDGLQNNFFTLFYVKDKKSEKINKDLLLKSHIFLENKKISDVTIAQKIATENVFIKKKIPFRSFEIDKRNEKILGELFCFFILETILLGNLLEVNPFDQPAVELIKNETNKILI